MAQVQQHALAREIDGGDLKPVTWANENERVVSKPVDGLMHWRTAEARKLPEILNRQELTRLRPCECSGDRPGCLRSRRFTDQCERCDGVGAVNRAKA